MSRNAALRAAKYDPNLLPQGPRDVVLDPWRDSGVLRWIAVREDRYPWEPR